MQSRVYPLRNVESPHRKAGVPTGWLREYGSEIPDGAVVEVQHFPRRRVVVKWQGRVFISTLAAVMEKVEV